MMWRAIYARPYEEEKDMSMRINYISLGQGQGPKAAAMIKEARTWCTGARRVIHRIVYRCSPRHPPHSVPVLAASSTA